MKIVLWIGSEANQKALANKIHKVFPLSGIVIEKRQKKRKLTSKKLFEAFVEKIFLRKIASAWKGMMDFYEKKFPSYPEVALLNVENINSEQTYQFAESIKPDLIVVSGTRLVKSRLLSLKPSIGIINLHTGLSPYVKGGPNCTNWCIATNQSHLIGNTIMWIDEGIDTGNILTTEFTFLSGNESLAEVHLKVMEHAHDLYCRSIDSLSKGKRPNVKQDEIEKGTTYYNKDWGLREKSRLIKNFKNFRKTFTTNGLEEKRKKVKTVSL